MDKVKLFLDRLEKQLLCLLCRNKCKDPVRIRTCDHYFCDNCLKNNKNPHACPNCSSYYELLDVEYDNVARKSEYYLNRLKEILQEKSTTSGNICKKQEPCTFYFNNKSYHVNYIESLTGKVNPKGETQLHLACKKKKLDIVKKLVSEKAVDINIKDHAGWAPLHEAVQSQCLEIIEHLLKAGCLIDIPGMEYTTPLHQAASLGNIKIVKLLLKYGADKGVVDYNGLKAVDLIKDQSIIDILDDKNKLNSKNCVYELYMTNKPTIYCHSIDDDYKKKFKSIKGITVEDKIDNKKKPTHIVIKKTHKISFKILQSMLMGIQFIVQESFDDFAKGNYFIPIPDYVFLANNENLNSGIKKAMISALLKCPKLFTGINFFIEHHNSPVSVYNLNVDKDYLGKLISFGGGRLLNRPPALRTCEAEFTHPYFSKSNSGTYRCSNFIIYEENKPPELKYKMPELQHKSSKWLIDCIIYYEIKE